MSGDSGHAYSGIKVTEFAAVLATAGLVEAGSPAAPAESVDTPSDESDALPTLPEQLFALLSSAWPAHATVTTPPAAEGSRDPLPAMPAPPQIINRTPLAAALPQGHAALPPAGPNGVMEPVETAATLMSPVLAPADTADDIVLRSIDAAPSFDALVPAAVASAPLVAKGAPTPPSPAPVPMPSNPDAGFDDGFGARIAWMAEQRLGHAEIRINPEHLGPVEVRVQLDGTRVSAEFHSVHAEVRQALEASVPRLRELLSQHGLQLGQADVGKQHSGQGGAAGASHDGRAGDAREEAGVEPATLRTRTRGLLDEYA